MRLPTEKFQLTATGAPGPPASGRTSRRNSTTTPAANSSKQVAFAAEPASRQRCRTAAKRAAIHGGLGLAVVVYIVLGAMAFQFFELSTSDLQDGDLEKARVLDLLEKIRGSLPPENISDTVKLRLMEILHDLRDVGEGGAVVDEDANEMHSFHSFAASVLFAFTAVSTIGERVTQQAMLHRLRPHLPGDAHGPPVLHPVHDHGHTSIHDRRGRRGQVRVADVPLRAARTAEVGRVDDD